jgi:hypothetical protein
MMAAVFGTLLIAFILDVSGLRRVALACLGLSLALCIWLVLWEVYSPDYGFRMPWLQVEMTPILPPPGAAEQCAEASASTLRSPSRWIA